MTPEDQEREQAIRARADAATPGEWRAEATLNDTDDPAVPEYWDWSLYAYEDDEEVLGGQAIDDPTVDLEFIAHARQDIPWLLDRLTEERERREAAEAACDPDALARWRRVRAKRGER